MEKEIVLRGFRITTNDVNRAIRHFDVDYPDTNSYKNWLENNTYKYALSINGRFYPPKEILRIAAGTSNPLVNAEVTVSCLKQLGFTVVKKPR